MTFDKNGFVRRSYEEILNETNENLKNRISQDVGLDSHHVLGQLSQAFSKQISSVEELAEEIVKQSNPATATGVGLDVQGIISGKIQRLPASMAQVILTITGESGYVVPEETEFSTEDGKTFFTTEEITLEQQFTKDESGNQIELVDENGSSVGANDVLAVSTEYSSDMNVPAKTITVISEPVEEIFTVNNAEPAEGGAELEVDSDYRKRILDALVMQPGPPRNGLISAIRSISGVKQVQIIENNTMQVDSFGNPPKIIHIYVLGGAKNDILTTIASKIAAGVETYGSISSTIPDNSGTPHEYFFDYANPLPIYIKASLETDDNWNIDSGVDDIKTAISEYIRTLNMQDELHLSKLYQFIYGVSGVKFADVKIGTSKENLTSDDIIPKQFEVITITNENIEIDADE